MTATPTTQDYNKTNNNCAALSLWDGMHVRDWRKVALWGGRLAYSICLSASSLVSVSLWCLSVSSHGLSGLSGVSLVSLVFLVFTSCLTLP